jgi:hypothetical protein
MGMSASQARYLALIAQQSNLEYQGQQINQERTVLSQQVSDLYNTLLGMEVPTPPSTQDYSTIVYEGSINATNYTFDTTNIKPGKNNKYTLSLSIPQVGDSLQKHAGTSTAEEKNQLSVSTFNPPNDSYKRGAQIVGNGDIPASGSVAVNMGDTAPVDSNGYYVLVDGNLEPYGEGHEDYAGDYYLIVDVNNVDLTTGNDYYNITQNPVSVSQTDFANLYVMNDDGSGLIKAEVPKHATVSPNGKYELNSNCTFFKQDPEGDLDLRLADPMITVGGYPAMPLEDAVNAGLIIEDDLDRYKKAIEHANIYGTNNEQYDVDDFYIYFDDKNNPHFVLKASLDLNNSTDTTQVNTYDFIANGQYQEDIVYEECTLTFDPSTGRITSIGLPITNAQGGIDGYTEMKLTATTKTDTFAYEDAMAEYKYKQYLYDKEQQDINARTEKIQQMDKNLQLKLQRLDTQRQQITTELEAVQKVMKDNIDKSYKVFNG